MEENRDTIGKLGDIIRNYNSLKEKDPDNELLNYVRIEGIGFCILEN